MSADLFKKLFKKRLITKRSLLLGMLVAALLLGAGWLTYSLKHEPGQPAKVASKPASVRSAKRVSPKVGILSDGWTYMPGTRLQKDGLVVEERGFKIVEQNGSGGQINSPVNLFGDHLQVVGNFAITARFKNPGVTTASIQFYGDVPIIADEFRIEPKSVRLTVSGKSLAAARWDGNTINPAFSQSFAIEPTASNAISVEKRDGVVVIRFNGKELGSIPAQTVFDRGNVWFGLDSAGGSWTLNSLEAQAAEGGQLTVVDSGKLPAVAKAADGLQTLAFKKRPDFLVGAAVALGPAVSDEAYRQVLLGGNFGAITTENALKWQFVHPAPNVYDFHEADALVALAEQNQLKVHGHTLVFGEANPAWVRKLPAAQREQAMLDHIKTVAGHFKGKIYSWDVVNEPFDDDEWDQLRPNIWQQAMGESYISKALTAARAADANALLFINDYGLEEDSERWGAMISLVSKLKKQGVPIDGVGFQAHVYERGDKISASVLRKHIKQLAALGLKARISEMDVYSEDGQATQASQYSQVFQACLAEANCVSFTTWGVTDRYDWFRDDDRSIEQGEDFLWNRDLKPTPAVEAIRRLLS